ncbi:MAG: stage V sporulation protein AD, partial [Clostridia bacterium]
EIKMQKEVITNLLSKANLKEKDIDIIFGGDLLNQIVAATFCAREFDAPFCGLYNACATFGESLCLGSVMVEKNCKNVVCITSSHYATAERQYRFPLELGTQPTPSSQWTVTGCGGALLSNCANNCPKICSFTLGKVVDLKCTDANNMGAAMAPAACDTIVAHLKDTGRQAKYYDLILTGDLGRFGRNALDFLAKKEGYDLSDKLNDCGCLVFSREQKVCQGGSGAGCCSLVFCAYFFEELKKRNFKKILFVPTGALMSKDSFLQGESIPSIAHAIDIEMED